MDLLKQLSETPGVSGDEAAVRAVIRQAIQDHVDEVRVDTLGNLIALKRGTGRSSLKVMLAAHMDEVGFMIVHIEKSGMLRFRLVNSIDPRILPSKVVAIGRDQVPGVIGFKPIHLLSPDERKKVVKVEDLAIDIGASNQQEAEKLVKPGDYATFRTPYRELGPTVTGKAFDDRAGCAVLVELLKGEYPFDVYGAFTVQEEIGLRGAKVAAYAIDPDVAIVLEGTVVDDLPKDRDVTPVTRLGGGPAITIMDRSVISDRRLVDLLVRTAQENDVPYQFKAPGVGGTDAGRIHVSREGVPSAVVAVPCRYIHAPTAMLSLEDFNHTVKLLRLALPALAELELQHEVS